MRGAGGTSGGAGRFFIGFVMMCGGFYLLLNAVQVTSSFGMGARLYGFAMGGAKCRHHLGHGDDPVHLWRWLYFL